MPARDMDFFEGRDPNDPLGGSNRDPFAGMAPEMGNGRLDQSPGGRDYGGRGNMPGVGDPGAWLGEPGMGAQGPMTQAPDVGRSGFNALEAWLGADVANWGNDRFDTPGGGSRPGGVDLAGGPGLGGLFLGGGNNSSADYGSGPMGLGPPETMGGMASGKETPGQGNPYAAGSAETMGGTVNPFAGGHGAPAGPSVPLGGLGAPVSPFMSENNAFAALQAQQQRDLDQYNARGGDATWGVAHGGLIDSPTATMRGDVGRPASWLNDLAGFNVRGAVSPPAPPGEDPNAPALPGRVGTGGPQPPAPPPIPGNPFPANLPYAQPQQPASAARGNGYTDPSLAKMPSLIDPKTGMPTGVTGYQGSSGVNRHVPAHVANSSIGPFLQMEEPFFHGALVGPWEGAPVPYFPKPRREMPAVTEARARAKGRKG